MKLLFITPFFRVPADFGIAIRNYQVLDHLTARHEVTVITYGEDESGETDSWLAARGASVVRLPYAVAWTSGTGRLMALRNAFTYPPASFQRFSARELSAAIESCLAKTPDIDLIIFDTGLTGQVALTAKLNKPCALIVLDIYAESLRKQFKVTGWRPHKLVRLVDWLKTGYYERRVLAQHENLIAVSRADEAYLKTNFPQARVAFSSNGVDTERFSRNGHKDDGKTLLFVGGFEYEPNVDAFFYFCREILPLVRAKQPDVKFVAVGRNPSAAMHTYAAASQGVELTGAVEDVRPFYGRASVVVLPLRFGSGMKLKTLEAFAMGVPVVSTPVGVEGIDAEDGIHCAVADTAENFAEEILELLSNHETAEETAGNARDLVEDRYGWKTLMSQLETYLVGMVRGHSLKDPPIELKLQPDRESESGVIKPPGLSVQSCPLCLTALRQTCESYDSEAILEMWRQAGVRFSPKVRQEIRGTSRITLHECSNCGFGVFLPCPIGSSGFYEELSRTEDYYVNDKWEFRRALVDLKNCDKVLEVGCGDGRFLEQLNCNRAIGLEGNPLAIVRAREKGLNVSSVTLKQFAREHQCEFDAVCAFQVLEHVPDPIEFVTAMKDCLKPGGLMVLGVPNTRGILRYVRPVPTDLPPHHLTRWESRCFEQLRNLGLRPISIRVEPLDAPRFHWIMRRWDHACGVVPDAHASWIENFRQHPLWLIGNVILHYGLVLLRRLGIKTLPVHGHGLYALLTRQ